jgi:hypothetical protein
MPAPKAFVGPRLRQLRRERRLTQGDLARALGLSASYVNLLENNQRSLSVPVLVKLVELFGVDWKDLTDDDSAARLADLRGVMQDPIFAGDAPDRQELRAALDHAPRLAGALLSLYKSYRALSERVFIGSEAGRIDAGQVLRSSPEAQVHDLFRRNRNYFGELEEAARNLRSDDGVGSDEVYVYLKRHLKRMAGLDVVLTHPSETDDALRLLDQSRRRVVLSWSLDHPNRAFQLAHVVALVGHSDLIDQVIGQAGIDDPRAQARCRVELANYFAAAVLMPYESFWREAESSGYDIDYLAARFGVSFEQACHRLTTLQRDGMPGVPFFFLRIDRAGNVTKRFSATDFHLAEYGGACPRWDIHLTFRSPGRIIAQHVELPDGARFFTVSRTVDRPVLNASQQDNRLAVTLGCAAEQAGRLVYDSGRRSGIRPEATPIGINCRLCPRHNCAQRAHQPIHLDLPIDETRRGLTRFES